MKICPNCYTTFNDDAMFCDNCGSQLRAQYVQAPPAYNPAGAVPPVPQKKNNTPLIIILVVVSILLVAAIGTGVFFLFFSAKSPLKFKDDVAVYEAHTHSEEVVSQEPETIPVVAENTTVSFTNPAPEVVDNEKVYTTFFNFYISYLDGINSMNSGMLDFCTPEVKSEMVERFQYNKKSLFDLSRIDYDVDSYTIVPNAMGSEYMFVVKCVTRMYERDTHEEKHINFAVWKVTVTETNGNCVVSKMERDDDYKMSSNVEVYDDTSSIF